MIDQPGEGFRIAEIKQFVGAILSDQPFRVVLLKPGSASDPLGLRRLPERTGVNIVASTGLYIEESWPEELRAADVDRLTEHMIGEVERGIGDTDVRAGHIGEIGLTTLSAKQERVLAAAAQAVQNTNEANCFMRAASLMVPAGIAYATLPFMNTSV